ncbi:helix-turn-helix domain-containing protein [Micromonospora sp. NPDC004704]
MDVSVQAFVVREIRLARMLAEQTQEQFAKRCSFSPSHVSAVENGTRPPTIEFIRAVDRGLRNGGLFERLWKELGGLDVVPTWVRERAEMERESTMLRWYEHSWVPGLLQTEAYVRAVYACNDRISPEEAERRITDRMERQRILDGENLSLLVAALDESVLHRPVGGPKVMHEQVLHLAKLAAEHPRVRLHVVPSSAGAYSGLDGQFVMARLASGEEVAYLDNQLQGQVATRKLEIAEVRDAWEAILGEALTPQQSIDKLMEVAETWN